MIPGASKITADKKAGTNAKTFLAPIFIFSTFRDALLKGKT
jgi:hypothetical protein